MFGGESDRFTLKAPERPALRRREGEPEDVPSTSRLFLSSQPAANDGESAYRSYSRPRSSLETGADRSEPVTSPRAAEQATEGRTRAGTLLSRNKELLTNLLTTHKSAAGGDLVSSSPQVPRRHRGASLGGTGGSLTGKLQWMKQTSVKHPLDVAGALPQSSSAVTSQQGVTTVQSLSDTSPKPAMTSSPSAGNAAPVTSPLRSPTATQSDSSLTAARHAPEATQKTLSEADLENKVECDTTRQLQSNSGSSIGSQSSAFRSPRNRPAISVQEATPDAAITDSATQKHKPRYVNDAGTRPPEYEFFLPVLKFLVHFCFVLCIFML